MKKDDVSEMSRRTFLAAVSAAASAPLLGAAVNHQDLAVEGGKPVRSTPLTTHYEGANFIDEKEEAQVAEAVRSRSLFRFYGFKNPEKTRNFELNLAKFMGTKYALAVTSGTAALHVALNALGVGPGDEVILPAWTWYSCYNAIVMTGALPVFVESDETFLMDPEDVKKKITPHTKVVMPVHLFGSPVDMDPILALAREHNLKVLEDSAQCCGGLYKGKRTGSMGDIATYSFQINKMISSGEGGAIVTSDRDLYERAIRFHDLGSVRTTLQPALGMNQIDIPGGVGINYRMNEESGAIMGVQLSRLEGMLARHREMYRTVRQKLSGLQGLKLRASNDRDGEIGFALQILLPSQEVRDKFIKAMVAENVPMTEIGAAVEREARDMKLDSEGRRALRQARSKPILDDIRAYLERERPQVLPKSPEGQAIAYTLSNWKALTRYAEDGDLEIDNNGAERSLRGIAVGRKNWMFYGSDNGGRTAALLSSLTATCKRLGMDPFAYLRDLFGRIAAHPNACIAELLPDQWKTARQPAPTS